MPRERKKQRDLIENDMRLDSSQGQIPMMPLLKQNEIKMPIVGQFKKRQVKQTMESIEEEDEQQMIRENLR